MSSILSLNWAAAVVAIFEAESKGASKLFKEQSGRCWAHGAHVPHTSGLLPNTAPGARSWNKSTSVAGARQACSWSESFGSVHPEGIQVQPSSVHQSRVWKSHLGKLLQNPAPHSVWNTQVYVPQVVLVLLFLFFGVDEAKLNYFLFCGSLKS